MFKCKWNFSNIKWWKHLIFFCCALIRFYRHFLQKKVQLASIFVLNQQNKPVITLPLLLTKTICINNLDWVVISLMTFQRSDNNKSDLKISCSVLSCSVHHPPAKATPQSTLIFPRNKQQQSKHWRPRHWPVHRTLPFTHPCLLCWLHYLCLFVCVVLCCCSLLI